MSAVVVRGLCTQLKAGAFNRLGRACPPAVQRRTSNSQVLFLHSSYSAFPQTDDQHAVRRAGLLQYQDFETLHTPTVRAAKLAIKLIVDNARAITPDNARVPEW